MAIGPGSKAPDFGLRNQHGETVRLSDFGRAAHAREPRRVLLVFYPFAFTPVCAGELRGLRDAQDAFERDGVQLLTVSNDSPYALRVFAEQEDLRFPLLSDFWPHGQVSRAYDVFDEEKGCALRGTFLIDTAGTVRWSVRNDIPDARDPEAYRTALRAL